MESVETRTACTYCAVNSSAKHPLFLYLITDDRVPLREIQNVPNKHHHAGLSSHPVIHTLCQNRLPGYRAGIKSTKAISPHWELQAVVPVLADATEHKNSWKRANKEKKLSIFLQHMYDLSIRQNTPIYCKDPHAIRSLIKCDSLQVVESKA